MNERSRPFSLPLLHYKGYSESSDNRLPPFPSFYEACVEKYFSLLVPQNKSVLEIGCGFGSLLRRVKPKRGVGIDKDASRIYLASVQNAELEFHVEDATNWNIAEQFDYILLCDVINELVDVQAALTNLRRMAHSRTRLVLNVMNRSWRPILSIFSRLTLPKSISINNWLSSGDLENLLWISGWEVIKKEKRILFPHSLPVVSTLLNRWCAPLFPKACLTLFMVARPRLYPTTEPNASETGHCAGTEPVCAPSVGKKAPEYTCSVIIPARNEAGNIENVVARMPELGWGTELIFVEGNSTDDTWDEILRVIAKYPNRCIRAIKQKGIGKGSAVRDGFAEAKGELLFILDADLSVSPEELRKFYEAAISDAGGLINGVRLVYPMQKHAMQFFNRIANELFGSVLSWLIGQKIRDALCGTKVIFRADYDVLSKNRHFFGDFDPFGDFDLLFGAAKLNLHLVDLPVRYQARTYGSTNIRRWKHGWLLLRMVVVAALRLKFV